MSDQIDSFTDNLGWKWRVMGPWTEKVRQELAGKQENLREQKNFKLLKESTTRSVFRMNGIIVKRHTVRALKESLKFTLSKSRAKEEWEILHQLKSNGIPCPEPIAMAEKYERGLFKGACLVISHVEFADLLPGSLINSPSETDKMLLLKKLALLIRTMHDKGFDHHDLHCGNFLMIQGEEKKLTPFPIDFHDVAYRKKLTQVQRIRGLSKLCFSMEGFTSEDDRMYFVGAYLKGGSKLSPFDPFYQMVQKRAGQLGRVRILSRSKRCVKQSKVYTREKRKGAYVFRRRDFTSAQSLLAIKLHKEALKSKGKRVIKDHPKTAITWVFLEEGDQQVCVKQFKNRNLLISFWRRFFGSKARRAWRNAHGLLVRGIDTPMPLACVEERSFGLFLKNSYLVSQYYEDAHPMDHCLRDQRKRTHLLSNDREREDLITTAASLLNRLHRVGAHHRDLAPKNWLVRREKSKWLLSLVDAEDLILDRGPSREEMIGAMVQLYDQPEILSKKDRLCFTKVYARNNQDLDPSGECEAIQKAARERWLSHCRILGLSPDEPEPIG